MLEVKYPEINVELVGFDGNAFVILGRVKQALEKGGISKEEIDEFTEEATQGDYDELLQCCMRWVNIS